MNSLENLNDWANDSVTYQDQTPYSITFEHSSGTEFIIIQEESAFASPARTNITVISAPRALEYVIDLSTVALPVVFNGPELPYYLTSTIENGNILRITGFIDQNSWQLLKTFTVQVSDQSENFEYTASLIYPDPAAIENNIVRSWTVNVTVTDTPELSAPSDYVYIKNSPGTIAGAPEILNSAAGPYNMVITPSDILAVYTLVSNGTDGTSTFDPVAKTLTVTGTKTQVNSHLANIVLSTNSDVQNAFDLTYTLTNPSGLISSLVQSLSSSEPFTIEQVTYLEDMSFDIGQVVNDMSATATSFTLSIAQTTPLPSVSAGYFTVNGSNLGTTWTITASKSDINSATVIFTPPVDYSDVITFTVNLSKVDNGNTLVQITNSPVNITNAGTNPEISNMINRNYTANTVNAIFSSQTPYINDGADLGQTYTIGLDSSIGKFGNSAANAIASASYSFTGNLTACNTEFGNMVFVPNANASLTGSYTYTQTRNSTPQITSAFTLTGTNNSITPAVYTFTANATWTPTFEQAYYGNAQILLVGGGGGAAGSSTSPFDGGGGGGGGCVSVVQRRPDSDPLYSGAHTITVGAGGAGGPFINTTTGLSYNQLGNSGQMTSVVSAGYTKAAAGGGGGRLSFNTTLPAGTRYVNNRGGNSVLILADGTSTAWTGGTGADFGLGGGGAGAGGSGTNAVAQTSGGVNGPGFSSNISGVTVQYAPGGSGSTAGNAVPSTVRGAGGRATGEPAPGYTNTQLATGVAGIVIIKIS